MISYDIYPKGSCKSFPEAMDSNWWTESCQTVDALICSISSVKPSMEMTCKLACILMYENRIEILSHMNIASHFCSDISGTLSMLLYEYALR